VLPFGSLPWEWGEGFDGISQADRPAAPGFPGGLPRQQTCCSRGVLPLQMGEADLGLTGIT